MAMLLHGTTRERAERIALTGPDPMFVELGGPSAGSFSAYFQEGPFHLGTPEMYAIGKARNFPSEGGPVIIEVDIPGDIIDAAADELLFPPSQGLVQFDPDHGLQELRDGWSRVAIRIRPVDQL